MSLTLFIMNFSNSLSELFFSGKNYFNVFNTPIEYPFSKGQSKNL